MAKKTPLELAVAALTKAKSNSEKAVSALDAVEDPQRFEEHFRFLRFIRRAVAQGEALITANKHQIHHIKE